MQEYLYLYFLQYSFSTSAANCKICHLQLIKEQTQRMSQQVSGL